ncbi:hypothetical protein Tco_0534830 [Tanacetum coccineum]
MGLEYCGEVNEVESEGGGIEVWRERFIEDVQCFKNGKDKVELDGKIVKEDKGVVKRIKGEALKEKDNPGAFVFPIRLEGKVNKNALENTGSDMNTMPYRIYETLGRAEIFDVLRTVESDSDDEEEYVIKRNKFGAPIYGPKPAPYLNCTSLKDRSSAIQTTLGTHDDEAGSSRSKRSIHETVEEFDEVCADDELQTKKIIKFRLGGRAHSLTLLEFARSREDNLGLSRSHTSTIRRPILRVIHKMITYGLCQRKTRYDKVQKNDLWCLSMFDARHQNGYANVAWLISRWMKTKGAGTKKESQICCGQFILKIARKCRVLTEDVVRSLSAPIYFRDLDTTTLRDLIDFDGRLIPEDSQPGVPRVGIPRHPRASMQDFVPMQGAYNPPGYAQPQYDQYYQQYPPPPPQYQQQQQDDDE